MDDYDDSSIAASLEDFDRSPTFGHPSIHSVYRSESEAESNHSSAPWNPPGAFSPAWRKGTSGWLRQQHFPAPGTSISHSTSPMYESAGEGGDETLMPANVPLPASPPKQTPADSPDRNTSPGYERDYPQPFGGGRAARENDRESSAAPDDRGNYIRFAMRAEVQHRTDPYEGAFLWVRDTFKSMTRTRTSTMWSFLVVVIAWTLLRSLFRPPKALPAPDMLKATQLAKTFEPLIYYSENGVQQISDLQDTSVAVWDLGESVRSTNMTSAPIIVRQLDDLSETLKTLAMELTRFFAHVDGDVDGILITMEWAKRRLQTIEPSQTNSLTSAVDNVHGMLAKIGLLESPTGPTLIGKAIKELFGETPSRRNSLTLQRTFNEFLTVLEESINNELQYSVALFGLFEAIEKQFQNLQRTVVREEGQQEREEGEMLSSLWARVIGTSATELKKFEKNKQLLANVRRRTVQNKGILLDHNGKLQQLKANLEVLRKKIVSPLVRSNDSSALSVEEQIAGLDDTYSHLKAVREQQRQKTLQMVYNTGSRRIGIVQTDDGHAIESGH